MSEITLPPAARRYFDAVAEGDADAVADSFVPDGEVIDVGRRIAGRDAIRRWARSEVIGGRYQILEVEPDGGRVSILLRFAPGGMGGFRARYDLELQGDQGIKRADLQYA